MTQKYCGTVDWFNVIKGFGVINCPELNHNVFVHYSDLVKGEVPTVPHKYAGKPALVLEAGHRVEFEAVPDRVKGLKALKVRVIR